jgi:hypothetical protein
VASLGLGKKRPANPGHRGDLGDTPRSVLGPHPRDVRSCPRAGAPPSESDNDRVRARCTDETRAELLLRLGTGREPAAHPFGRVIERQARPLLGAGGPTGRGSRNRATRVRRRYASGKEGILVGRPRRKVRFLAVAWASHALFGAAGASDECSQGEVRAPRWSREEGNQRGAGGGWPCMGSRQPPFGPCPFRMTAKPAKDMTTPASVAWPPAGVGSPSSKCMRSGYAARRGLAPRLRSDPTGWRLLD